MDREERLRQLINPSATRKMVFAHVKRIAEDRRAKMDSVEVQEFAEFALLRNDIKEAFGLHEPYEQKLGEFVLAFASGLADAITENNERLLQALSEEET